MKTSSINRVIEDFNALLLPEKEYALDIIRKMTIEQKREALAKRAKEAMLNLKKGKVKTGSVKDLRKDLESD
ncbi:MAG TPA: hypothetical protein VK808_07640 [Bacteroidia bacterium]|jgi:hypothetical protein|nr:hypothetical protein [Bacteroidia bacterium]